MAGIVSNSKTKGFIVSQYALLNRLYNREPTYDIHRDYPSVGHWVFRTSFYSTSRDSLRYLRGVLLENGFQATEIVNDYNGSYLTFSVDIPREE